MNNRRVYVLAMLFAALGLALFAYKVVILKFPVTADDAPDNWEIETKVSFNGAGGPAAVRLHLPRNTLSYLVLDQSFTSRDTR